MSESFWGVREERKKMKTKQKQTQTNKSNNGIDAYVLFITSQRPEDRSSEGIKVELIINMLSNIFSLPIAAHLTVP